MTAKKHDLRKLFCITYYIYSEWYWNIASINQKEIKKEKETIEFIPCSVFD